MSGAPGCDSVAQCWPSMLEAQVQFYRTAHNQQRTGQLSSVSAVYMERDGLS